MRMLNNFFRSTPKIPYYYIRGYTKKVDISKDIPEFSLLASRIILQKKTMLNFDRLYTIYQLVKNMKDNLFRKKKVCLRRLKNFIVLGKIVLDNVCLLCYGG